MQAPGAVIGTPRALQNVPMLAKSVLYIGSNCVCLASIQDQSSVCAVQDGHEQTIGALRQLIWGRGARCRAPDWLRREQATHSACQSRCPPARLTEVPHLVAQSLSDLHNHSCHIYVVGVEHLTHTNNHVQRVVRCFPGSVVDLENNAPSWGT